MAIPMKGEHTIQVEAGEYTLAYTLGACAAIEGQFEGRGLQSILRDLESEDENGTPKDPKISTMLVVIWAGLKKHHNLSLDEVGDLITMSEVAAWGEGIGRAINSGNAEARGDARPRKAAAKAR